MEEEIAEWFAEQSNMASVPAVADLLGVDVNYVRDWARDNDVPRVGVAFVFSAEQALELWAELEDDDDDDDDDSEDDDENFVCTGCDSPVDADAAYCSACGACLEEDEAALSSGPASRADPARGAGPMALHRPRGFGD